MKNVYTVLHSDCTNLCYTNSVEEFPFLHGLTGTRSLSFRRCPSSGYEAVPHRLDCHFPDGEWSWASFHVPVGLLYVFFGKCEFRLSAHFLIRLLIGLFTYLYILLLCIRYVISRFFFDSVGCLFILLMLSFVVQKKPFIWSSPASLFLLLLLIFIFMYQKLRIWNSGQGLPFTKECCFFY